MSQRDRLAKLAALRVDRDLIANPMPGDVVEINKQWRRSVTHRTASDVWFTSTFDPEYETDELHLTIHEWRSGLSDVPTEVIYVSPR